MAATASMTTVRLSMAPALLCSIPLKALMHHHMLNNVT
jgi:hypothetical protein